MITTNNIKHELIYRIPLILRDLNSPAKCINNALEDLERIDLEKTLLDPKKHLVTVNVITGMILLPDKFEGKHLVRIQIKTRLPNRVLSKKITILFYYE